MSGIDFGLGFTYQLSSPSMTTPSVRGASLHAPAHALHCAIALASPEHTHDIFGH